MSLFSFHVLSNLRIYLKGPKFTIVSRWWWIYKIWVGSFLPVLGADSKQGQVLILKFFVFFFYRLMFDSKQTLGVIHSFQYNI